MKVWRIAEVKREERGKAKKKKSCTKGNSARGRGPCRASRYRMKLKSIDMELMVRQSPKMSCETSQYFEHRSNEEVRRGWGCCWTSSRGVVEHIEYTLSTDPPKHVIKNDGWLRAQGEGGHACLNTSTVT